MGERFEAVLAVGGKANSLGRAAEVVSAVHSDPSRLDELFDCIFADDAWVRMRAIDSFEKIIKEKPEWVSPYLHRIFSELLQSSQPSIQWHLAQIFTEVELTTTQRNQAIAWLKDRLETTDVDWIVSVNAMKALLHFQESGFVTTREVAPLVKVQEAHKSKSVRRKAETFSRLLKVG